MSQLGLFRTWATICADVPWPYDDPGIRGGIGTHYESMPIEQIVSLPVYRYAADQAHLYLWITNAWLLEGIGARICRAWGFEPKTVITWDKMLIGTGHYYRNQTEHCIFATRGNLDVQVHNLLTIIRVRRSRRHSEKPAGVLLHSRGGIARSLPRPIRPPPARGATGVHRGDQLHTPVSLPALEAAARRNLPAHRSDDARQGRGEDSRGPADPLRVP